LYTGGKPFSGKNKKLLKKKEFHPMIRPERESNLAPLDCRSRAQTTMLLGCDWN